MARMVSCIQSSFARIALNRSQAQRYVIYANRLFETQDKVLFDDRLRDAIIPFILPSFDWQQQIDQLNGLNCEEDGTPFSRSYYNPDKIKSALERFDQPNHPSFRWNSNYQRALEELKLEFSNAQLKVENFATDQDVAKALPKSTTHSGFLYILTGSKKKGDNLKGICSEVNQLEKTALETGNFGVPILIGHRTQGSAHDEFSGEILEIGKHKTRLVCMVDMRVIVSELKFAKPLQKYLSRFCLWYSGGKTPGEMRSAIYWNSSRYSDWTSLDYSSFDQTISDWLIEDAFSVIRSAFVLRNDYESRLLDVICDSFIHKEFLLPDGKVNRCDKGVPSGSMFTQIIDSIVNMLMIKTYVISKHENSSSVKSNVMGDDHLLQHNFPIDRFDLEGYLKTNFGIIMNAKKCVVKTEERVYPWYLSREFRGTGEWRHPNVLFDRMLFPERRRPYVGNPVIPEDIIYCFIQTYPLGMRELIDVDLFLRKYDPTSRKEVLDSVDGIWLPGSYVFNRDYNLIYR